MKIFSPYRGIPLDDGFMLVVHCEDADGSIDHGSLVHDKARALIVEKMIELNITQYTLGHYHMVLFDNYEDMVLFELAL